MNNLNLGDYFVALIHGLAIYGAIDVIPGFNWYVYILPLLILAFTVFYFNGRVRYDDSKPDWGDPEQKL